MSLAQALLGLRILVRDKNYLGRFMRLEIADDVWPPIPITDDTDPNHEASYCFISHSGRANSHVLAASWCFPQGVDLLATPGRGELRTKAKRFSRRYTLQEFDRLFSERRLQKSLLLEFAEEFLGPP